MMDGICILHTETSYMFHYFYNPTYNDKDISKRLNIIQLKINKQ